MITPGFFIRRPILSIALSLTIVVLGIVGLITLPVEQYPNIAPPTVSVKATYPGANAETVQRSVIVPLEEAINGVEGMTYVTSEASNDGTAILLVYFHSGTDPDMATINVLNRVATAQSLLPDEVVQIGVATEKYQNSELKTIALYDPAGHYTKQFLDNYMKINVEPKVKRVPGVGKVDFFGSSYSMRLWLKPDRMARYGLIPSDITTILAGHNIEAPAGAFGENHDNAKVYSLKYRGRLSSAEEFGEIVVKSLPDGDILRLKEVADIELGDEDYNFENILDSKPASIMKVCQTSDANAAAVIRDINKVLDECAENLPRGLEFVTLSDANIFLFASIREVVWALVIALVLVVLIIFAFLQDIKATIIPAIAVIVSVTGTFGFMAVAGFSINLLTLFALVLAIGTVVDNALVIVEAVQAQFEEGRKSPYTSTLKAMEELTSSVVLSTIVFLAILIPVALTGGSSGLFYKEFGIVLGIAVALSALNALTLSPALCALLMSPEDGSKGLARRVRKAYSAAFAALTKRYGEAAGYFVRHRLFALGLIIAGIVILIGISRTLPKGFIPDEDTGTITVSINTRPGTSAVMTRNIVKDFDRRLASISGIAHRGGVSGYSLSGTGPTSAIIFLPLKDWNDRLDDKESATAIIDSIYALVDSVPDASFFVCTPPIVPGYGLGNGFEIYLQDFAERDFDEFKKVADDFMRELTDRPEIETAYTAFDTRYPQYWVDIDAAQCERVGLTPADVLSTLGGYLGGNYASDFNRFNRLYRVMIQADPATRVNPESLKHLFIRTDNGEMAPLAQFVTLTKTYGPQTISRFNLCNSIAIKGYQAEGYSSGDALKAIEEAAEKILPRDYGYELGGLSREESSAGRNTPLIFLLCTILVYAILAARYESLLLPLAVMLPIPCALMGSFLLVKLAGMQNNVYLQTGLIMLIGLFAKAAILLTEYACRYRREGMTLKQAAICAAKSRLRPILMTSLIITLGMLPLMFPGDVGTFGNSTLGTCVVGGMIVGTLTLLFLVPALWMVCQTLHERIRPLGFTEKLLPILIIGIMTVSCAGYKKYTPVTSVPDELYGPEAKNMQDTTSIANIDWREFFTDRKLQALIDTALIHNTDYQVAQLRTEQARASLGAARLAYVPSAQLEGDGELSKYVWTRTRYYTLGVTSSWETDIFGRLTAAKRGAAAAVVSAEEQAQAVRTQLIATIASSYYSLVMLDRQIEIARFTLDNWNETIRVMELLKKAGKANEAGILQTKSNRTGLEAGLVTLERTRREIETSLCALIAGVPDTISRGTIEDAVFDTTLTTGLPVQLLANRPDVRAAEMEVARTHYGVGEARASFYPSLTIDGTIVFTNSGNIDLNPGEWFFKAVGQLVQPIFNRGKLKANYKIAQAEREIALLQFNQALIDAGKEVNDALTDISAARERLRLARYQTEYLREAVEKTELLMRHSPISYLEVLTAQHTLLGAQQAEVECRYDEIAGIISLYHALGGGR